MCGRARLSSDVSEIKLVFSIPPDRPTPNIAPSWNAAPTDPLLVVRYDRRAGERTLDVMRWGLVPFWAKDTKVAFANINAKVEGMVEVFTANMTEKATGPKMTFVANRLTRRSYQS
jgi:putative SOS response-associated peptidase YedK